MNASKYLLCTLLLAVTLTVSRTPVFAQDEDNAATPVEQDGPKKVSGGYGYFMPGFRMQDIAQLNSFLGTDAFSGNGFTLGGGGTLIVRSLMLSGEGGSYLKRSATVGATDLTLESGWGQFSLGYVVYGRKGLLLYPKVGIGGSSETLTLNLPNAPQNVDSVFAGGFTGTTMTKKAVNLSFGAGFDWMPGFDETAGSGVVLGFDLGYNLAVSEKSWEAYGKPLTGGPSLTGTGIYANLHIGFAGWNRQ